MTMKRLLAIAVVLALTSECGGSVAGLPAPNVRTAAVTPPIVAFRPTGDRSLIAVNNPEQLWTYDFADKNLGNVAILRVEDVRGKVRNWWELYNRAGFTAGYGVVVYNPHPTKTVMMTITGQGFTPTVYGGLPFEQMLNKPTRVPVRIGPQQLAWLMRKDDSIPNETIFSGAIDFEISSTTSGEAAPPVHILNFIYRNYSDIDHHNLAHIKYMGYITRKEKDGENEARVYKGTTSHIERTAPNMDFVIDDSSKRLTVQYPLYNFTTGTYGPTMFQAPGWISNIGANNVPHAVMSDMAAFYTPGWGFIDPNYKSDAALMYPNSGNYGIEYHIQGTITNVGSQQRQVEFNILVPSNCPLLAIAYRNWNGTWASQYVSTVVPVVYLSVPVPAGGQPVAYLAKYIVGGPACGNLLNYVQVVYGHA